MDKLPPSHLWTAEQRASFGNLAALKEKARRAMLPSGKGYFCLGGGSPSESQEAVAAAAPAAPPANRSTSPGNRRLGALSAQISPPALPPTSPSKMTFGELQNILTTQEIAEKVSDACLERLANARLMGRSLGSGRLAAVRRPRAAQAEIWEPSRRSMMWLARSSAVVEAWRRLP